MVAKKEKIEVKEPRYIIVSSQRALILQDLVNEKILAGYQPIGGIGVVAYKGTASPVTEFYQAMTRPESYVF
ncbi:MAG: hypothetical protein WC657_03665 [Candidatus Paceibacterota bacterium]|jgi:hypothetical protein